MSDVRREVKEYNQAVVNNTFLPQRAACPCCHAARRPAAGLGVFPAARLSAFSSDELEMLAKCHGQVECSETLLRQAVAQAHAKTIPAIVFQLRRLDPPF